VASTRRYIVHRRAGAIVAVGALIALATPAQAFFDMFFRGHMRPAPQMRSYANPDSDRRASPSRRGGEQRLHGPRSSVDYCVRLCDGRYFPVNYRGGGPELCSSMCPASETKIFSGRSIDSARSEDGERYSKIPNAYVYRERLVPGCSCTANNPLGLAPQDIAEDPTLRKGDILATDDGYMSYRGRTKRYADFVPLDMKKLPKAIRGKLAKTKVRPAPVLEQPAEARAAPASRYVERNDQTLR
jgi:hypothetical protein